MCLDEWSEWGCVCSRGMFLRVLRGGLWEGAVGGKRGGHMSVGYLKPRQFSHAATVFRSSDSNFGSI